MKIPFAAAGEKYQGKNAEREKWQGKTRGGKNGKKNALKNPKKFTIKNVCGVVFSKKTCNKNDTQCQKMSENYLLSIIINILCQ